MMKLSTVVTYLCVLMIASIGFLGEPNTVNSAPVEYRLGVAHGNSLYSNKEQFEFTLGNGQKVVLNSANPVVYFTSRFTAGQSYSVTQTAGPRACNLFGANQGTFANQDIVITANCGNPPLSIFKLQVSGIEQGETFKFADNYRRTYQYPFSTIANLGGYPQGDNYSVTQTSGPRPCKMTNNQGVVPVTNLTVIADCRKITAGDLTGPTTKLFPDVELVSRSTDGKFLGTYYENWTPVLGGTGADEGRYVAFVSQTVGIAGATGKFRQVIWRDRKTGETKLISASASGGEGNQNSLAPAISADGRSVAFESYATNLVPDTNSARDVFVWNADSNRISAVSENRGVEANAEAFQPTISADGNLIAFSSYAGNLTPDVDGTSTVNVFLRDMRSGSVTLISKNEKTKKGGGGSDPSISEDGSRIAFYNYAALQEDDRNDLWDIYVWQSGSPKLKRVSKPSNGGERNQGDESRSRVVAPSISGDGSTVAFASTASNMVAGDSNGHQDVFVINIDSGSVERASAKGSIEGNADSPIGQGEKIGISYDGRRVAFNTAATNLGANIVIRIVGSSELIPVTMETGPTVGPTALSRSGNYIAFGTSRRLDTKYQSSGLFVLYKGR